MSKFPSASVASPRTIAINRGYYLLGLPSTQLTDTEQSSRDAGVQNLDVAKTCSAQANLVPGQPLRTGI